MSGLVQQPAAPGAIGNVPPAEAEVRYHAAQENLLPAAWLKPNSLRRTRGGLKLPAPKQADPEQTRKTTRCRQIYHLIDLITRIKYPATDSKKENFLSGLKTLSRNLFFRAAKLNIAE
jgi:hypothetical protein